MAIFLYPQEEKYTYVANEQEWLTVDIQGAVYRPGYYEVPNGALLHDLVVLAGGFRPEAHIEKVNLLERLESKTYIVTSYPSREDAKEREETQDYQITYNLNQVTYQQLITVPSITENRALNILSYRQEIKIFTRVEELLNVSGIGQVTFDRIKDYFTV